MNWRFKIAKKLTVLFLVTIMILGIFGLTGCEPPEPDKIEIGFEGGRGAAGKYGKFFCGAKSNTVIFDASNVEIDFYFGHANQVSGILIQYHRHLIGLFSKGMNGFQ